MARNGTLNRKFERAIFALLEASTVGEAAARAGISRRTLERWLARPDFQERLRATQAEVRRQAIAQLQAAMTEAVQILRYFMTDKTIPPSVRLGAARATLEFGLRFYAAQELEERVVRLEKSLGVRANGTKL